MNFLKLKLNHQMMIKYQQNGLKQGVEQFVVRFINLLFLFGIRRNCLRSERSQSYYLSIRRTIKQIVVVKGAYHFRKLRTKFYPTFCSQG